MNYKQIYEDIINNAKEEEKKGLRKKGNGNYYEAHHILPKSLFPEYSKVKENIVLLTGEEHFKCHQLLKEIYPSAEMNYAMHAFISRPNCDYKISEGEYAKLKQQHAEFLSKLYKGRSVSEEAIKKIRETKERNGTWGKKPSEEQKRKYSETMKKKRKEGYVSPIKGKKFPGRINSTSWSKGHVTWNKGIKLPELSEQRKGEGNPMYGKKFYTNGNINVVSTAAPEGFREGMCPKNINPETEKLRREKISRATKGKHWYNNGVTNILTYECPEGFKPGFLTPRIYKK